MSCCGQRRAAASVSTAAASTTVAAEVATAKNIRARMSTSTPQNASQQTASHTQRLRYLGNNPLSLRGPNSGRAYYFAEEGAQENVDEKDLDALLRTQLFAQDAQDAQEVVWSTRIKQKCKP